MKPMISLTTTVETELKQLDKDKASILWGLLGLTIAPEYDDFFDGTNPQYYASDSWDFCGFFYDVLLEKNTPCVVHFDWKWHPDDVFWQLKQNLPAYDIELLEAKDDPDYLAYEVSYRVGKNTANIKVNFSEPNQLLNDISRWLPDKQFIDLNFGEDSYSWLIVPATFDTERFLEITGLKRTDERASLPLQPRYDARHPNLALDYKQPRKIFFLPNIIYVEDDQNGYFFRYKKSGSNATVTYNHPVWAGRVLPGQTVKEGIAVELESELGYTGRFDYAFAGYENTIKHKQGKDVHRYRLTVLLYDKSFSDTTRSGYKIDLQKMPGFSISLLPLYKT
jgi:hypothetical protein